MIYKRQFSHIMPTLSERDSKADAAIRAMIVAVIGTALVPAHINWALTASAMGVGVIAIGAAYDVKLNKDEAWKYIKQFFLAAGSWFIAMNIGSKIFSMILSSTGIGHVGAVALDSAVSSAAAYAIGACSKEYFRRDYQGKSKPSKEELGRIFRETFKKHKG